MSAGELRDVLWHAHSAAEAAADAQIAASDELIVLSQVASQMWRELGRFASQVEHTLDSLKENVVAQTGAKHTLDSAIGVMAAAADGSDKLDNPIATLQTSSAGAGDVLGRTSVLVENLPTMQGKLNVVEQILGSFIQEITGISSVVGRNIAATRAANEDVANFAESL
jgi:ABC-type transporter Mla subunit MlaD